MGDGSIYPYYDEAAIERIRTSSDKWRLIELGWNGNYYSFMRGEHKKIDLSEIIPISTPQLFIFPPSTSPGLYRKLIECDSPRDATAFIRGKDFDFNISLTFDPKSTGSRGRSLHSSTVLSVQYFILGDVLYKSNLDRIK
ncbi:MAG: hypothetical protein AABW63_02530 [Nanoarchaeota archaeon]